MRLDPLVVLRTEKWKLVAPSAVVGRLVGATPGRLIASAICLTRLSPVASFSLGPDERIFGCPLADERGFPGDAVANFQMLRGRNRIGHVRGSGSGATNRRSRILYALFEIFQREK